MSALCREKRRDLNQSYAKTFTLTKKWKATSYNTKWSPKRSITQRLQTDLAKTVSWSNYSYQTGVVICKTNEWLNFVTTVCPKLGQHVVGGSTFRCNAIIRLQKKHLLKVLVEWIQFVYEMVAILVQTIIQKTRIKNSQLKERYWRKQ